MVELDSLFSLVKRKRSIDSSRNWSKGSRTYFEELYKELMEVKQELEKGTGPHLEDELGDVLWDFCNLLENLEQEGKIKIEEVFRRSQEKYSQRILGVEQGFKWEDIKYDQKKQLLEEEREFQGES